MYDFWDLCATPGALPGFMITDPFSPTGGLLWPTVYRPYQVCRQLGWDQPPCEVNWSFVSIGESMKAVLFKDDLPPYDSALLIPHTRQGVLLRTTSPIIML